MPFVSDRQRRWMWANRPEMAHRWAEHTPSGTVLPEKAPKKKKKQEKTAFWKGFTEQLKLAFIGDGAGGFLDGIGKGTDKGDDFSSDVSEIDGLTRDKNAPQVDMTLLDRERNPRSFDVRDLGPDFEAEDGSHVIY